MEKDTILDQAIGEEEALGNIFGDYQNNETIKIEIVPKIVKIVLKSQGLEHNFCLKRNLKIYGRFDDLYIPE